MSKSEIIQLFGNQKSTNALELELYALHGELTRVSGALQHTGSELKKYKLQAENDHKLKIEFQARIKALEERKAALEFRVNLLQLSADQAKQLAEQLASSEQKNQGLARQLSWYQDQWSTVVGNDRQMREIIATLKQQFQRKLTEQKELFEKEKSQLQEKLQLRLEQQSLIHERERAEFEIAKSDICAVKHELKSEQLALKTTTDSMLEYQIKYNYTLTESRKLHAEQERLLATLQELELQVSKLLPIEKQEMLIKQNERIHAENEQLRSQLLLKISSERELDSLKKENEQLRTEFAREEVRFRELAEADHSARAELWVSLSRTEKELDRIRKKPVVPPPFKSGAVTTKDN